LRLMIVAKSGHGRSPPVAYYRRVSGAVKLLPAKCHLGLFKGDTKQRGHGVKRHWVAFCSSMSAKAMAAAKTQNSFLDFRPWQAIGDAKR
jgi:hypothetical protein